jgi:hypothetical protein
VPGYLLDKSAVVTCAHTGTASPVIVSARVKISGMGICVATSMYQISGCVFPPPPAGNGPCVTATFTTSALRVKSNGVGVLLQDGIASCIPTGTPLMVVKPQVRVKGM